MIYGSATRFVVPQPVDMRKRISFFCLLAVALAATCMCEVDLEPEVKPKVVPDNTNWPTNGFDSRIDSTNESDDTIECGEAPIRDDFLESEEANDTEMISPSAGHRISGGYQANITNHPYQVSVHKLRYRSKYYCGGSIISKNWVLTAAHCSLGAPSEFTVRAGSSKRTSGGTLYRVSSIYIHYLYIPKGNDYDIAVMLIDGIFEYNQFVQPIPLAKSLPKIGANVTLSGWGRTSCNGSRADHLRAVNLTVSTREECIEAFPYLTFRMFCAGYSAGGRGSCKGDSGGPLVFRGVQVGLVKGSRCHKPKLPSLFTSVPYFRDWIRFYTGV